jgi:hypothetical protein
MRARLTFGPLVGERCADSWSGLLVGNVKPADKVDPLEGRGNAGWAGEAITAKGMGRRAVAPDATRCCWPTVRVLAGNLDELAGCRVVVTEGLIRIRWPE